MIFLFLLLSTFANAGDLVRLQSSEVTGFSYKYGQDCDSFTLTANGKTFKGGPYCSGQAIIQDRLNAFLQSPRTQECIKYENCIGNRCSREYGIREVSEELMLFVDAKNKIENFKLRTTLGFCQ
ncbi:MAG: hypothetical protein M9962_07245 [Oligoflexia bacterium]|nr:hypothetical protein [Oligoflexia bacterium]